MKNRYYFFIVGLLILAWGIDRVWVMWSRKAQERSQAETQAQVQKSQAALLGAREISMAGEENEESFDSEASVSEVPAEALPAELKLLIHSMKTADLAQCKAPGVAEPAQKSGEAIRQRILDDFHERKTALYPLIEAWERDYCFLALPTLLYLAQSKDRAHAFQLRYAALMGALKIAGATMIEKFGALARDEDPRLRQGLAFAYRYANDAPDAELSTLLHLFHDPVLIVRHSAVHSYIHLSNLPSLRPREQGPLLEIVGDPLNYHAGHPLNLVTSSLYFLSQKGDPVVLEKLCGMKLPARDVALEAQKDGICRRLGKKG